MGDYFKRVAQLTPTRLWVNNVTVEQARRGIAAGATGCTQNPTYVAKMLKAEPELCRKLIDKLLSKTDDDTEVLIKLQAELVGRIAGEFLPLYESSGGRLGYVTIQGDPFEEKEEKILRQAEIARAYGPNVMIKIPVIPEGIKAIGKLAAEGVPLCCTEVFALDQAIDVCEAFMNATGGRARPVACLAHIAGIYDEYLGGYVTANAVDIAPDVLWYAGIAVAKKVYEVMRERRYPLEFLGGGARGTHHFTEMVGAAGSVTINWAGMGEELEEADPLVIQRFQMPTPPTVIDELARKLPDFAKGYFEKSLTPGEYEGFGPVALFRSMFEEGWRQGLAAIARRRAA